MKKIVTFLIILLSNFLFAKDINLEDIVIKGKSSSIIDSIKLELHPKTEWQIDNINKLNYYFRSTPIPAKMAKPKNQKNLLEISAGNYSLGKINFSSKIGGDWQLSYRHKIIQKDWFDSDFSFGWSNKKYDFLRLDYLGFSTKNEFSDNSLNYHSTILQFDDMENFNSIFESMKISNLDFRFFPSYYQNYQKKTSTDFNFSASSTINSTKYLQLNPKINYYHKFLSGSMLMDFSKIPYIDKFGIWFGTNKNGFYPSLKYSYKYNYKNIELSFNQNPEMHFLDYAQLLSENIYQQLKQQESNRVDIINSTFKVEHEFFFKTSAFYNIIYTMNENYYEQIAADSLYKINFDDYLKQKFGFEIRFNLSDLIFSQQTSVLLVSGADEYIPYLPNIASITSIEYLFDKVNFNIVGNYFSQIKDENGVSIDNRFILNSKLNYSFRPQLKFYLEAGNLFDNRYRKYNNIPETGVNVSLGCKWMF